MKRVQHTGTHFLTFYARSAARQYLNTGLFYRDLGARWLHDDSRWRPSKEGKRSKEGWRICTVRATKYLSGLERAGNAVLCTGRSPRHAAGMPRWRARGVRPADTNEKRKTNSR